MHLDTYEDSEVVGERVEQRLEIFAPQGAIGAVGLAIRLTVRSALLVDGHLDKRHHHGHPNRRSVVAAVWRGSVDYARSPIGSTCH